jgi:predicted nucleic acid-binding protein
LEPYFSLLVPLFRRVQRGDAVFIVSVITEAELLVRPERERDQDAIERVGDLLSEDGIQVVPVSRQIARQAAAIRAQPARLGLPDAIIIATALATNCEAIVSNDGDWRRLTDIPFVCLDDVVAAGQKTLVSEET